MPTYSLRKSAALFQVRIETPARCQAELPPITGTTNSRGESIPTLHGCDLRGLMRDTSISTP